MRWVRYACVSAVLVLMAAIVVPTLGYRSECGQKTTDSANLRQIAQASIIYAVDHTDNMPQAPDVWSYAALLAKHVGLNQATVWQSKRDPASENFYLRGEIVPSSTTSDSPEPTAKFRRVKPAYAVPVGKLRLSLPATTPIAWTRGLQPNGTWSKDSPYGEEGGYIAFIGGNVDFYRNLTDDGGQLVARDGSKTANILDTLPPGTRISEYTPTSAETAAWSKQERRSSEQACCRTHVEPIVVVIFSAIWAPSVVLSVHRACTRRPGALRALIWPALLTILLLLIIPTISS